MVNSERLVLLLVPLFANHANGFSQMTGTREKLELVADRLLRLEPIEDVNGALGLVKKSRIDLVTLRTECLLKRIERMLTTFEEKPESQRTTERAAYEHKLFTMFEQASGWEIDPVRIAPLQAKARELFVW